MRQSGKERLETRRRFASMIANVDDRTSIERIYPAEVFVNEAGVNSAAKAEILHGVRIASAIDEHGDFELHRASRHVGEAEDGPDQGIFLAPFLTAAADSFPNKPGYDAPARHHPGRDVHGSGEYRAFIDRVIATAKAANFRPPPAPGDERLRGPRQ